MTNTTFSSKTEEHFISVNGISTRYLAAGKGDPILLIHGVGAFAEFWHPVMDHLSPYYRVIALDLVGHGRSEK
ncbi:MAG: alpha/beta fold hydrolase, partial [Chitinispirillaceae bacterium]